VRDNNTWAASSTNDLSFGLFSDGGIIASADTINAVKMGAVAKRSSGGGRTHKLRRRLDTTDTDTTVTLSTADGYFEAPIFTTTFANLNLTQIGGEKSGSAAGQSMTIEDNWLMVDYLTVTTTTLPSGVTPRLRRLLGVGRPSPAWLPAEDPFARPEDVPHVP